MYSCARDCHEKGIESELFEWASNDGSRVTAFRIPFEYCTWPDELKEHVLRCAGEIKGEEGSIMCFYGVGNHGGGPIQTEYRKHPGTG